VKSNLFASNFWYGYGTFDKSKISEPLSEYTHLGRIPGDPRVYLITWGQRRPIEDDATFAKCRFDASKIRESADYINLPEGDIIGLKGKRYPDCTWFRIGSMVKVILGGQVRWVWSDIKTTTGRD
jgi:hypothetical protein